MSTRDSGRCCYPSFWCAVVLVMLTRDLFLCLWWLSCPSFDMVMLAAGTSNNKDKRSDAGHHKTLPLKNNAVMLVPGELPGYTGWARLEQTLAGSFQITPRQHKTVIIRNKWNVTVQCLNCQHNITGDQHAQFYARAYSPAVLAGNTHEINNTVYTIGFLPMDPGLYHVEVVLVSSEMPSWNVFLLSLKQEEPTYEGFLLQDFPLQLQVLPSPFIPQTSLNQSCTMSNCIHCIKCNCCMKQLSSILS